MTNPHPDIIIRVQHGDEAAFQSLIEACYASVFRVAFRVATHSDDARDITQEVFIKVWSTIHLYDSRRPFGAWLYTIASRTALDFVRSRNRRATTPLPDSDSDVFLVHDAVDLAANASAQDLTNIVAVLLRHLPPVQRLVIALRDFEDLTVDEVCTISGMSSASVKTNLSYARRAIRHMLATRYNERGTP